jgi:uncharacterized membrane-anchored protein
MHRTAMVAVGLLMALSDMNAPLVAQSTIDWTEGPSAAQLGSEATLAIPAGCVFTERQGARQFMIETQNQPSGKELGVLLCESEGVDDHWFVVFSYDGSGYVRDDEGGSINADAILASVRKGTDKGNEYRRSQGWETLRIVGWSTSPYYDPETNNLTWAIEAEVGTGAANRVVNHSVRLLGRGGVMHVDLVAGPEQVASTMPVFASVVASHSFVPGRRYAEWRDGDKIASYGLTALVAGGVGAAAVKSGLLARFWKLILIPIVALFAWLKSLFARKEEQARF